MKKLRTIKNLSWSQISAYERCNLAWYLHYVKKLWPEEKPQPLAFGIAYHSAIETFLNEYYFREVAKEVAISNACSKLDYAYTFGRDRGADPKKWLPIGNTMVRATIAAILKKDFRPIETEQYVVRNRYSGRIDCRGLVGADRVIVDWKTATNPFTQRKVDTDGQLTGYGYLLPGEWDKMAFVVAIKETSQVHWYETTRTQEQIKEFEKMISDTRLKMECGEKFIGVHDHNICRFCDLQPYHCRGTGSF